MPSKFFRKYLPSHATILQNRYIGWFGPLLKHHNLWHLHRRAVAGGVAVGMFTGLVPGSNPVQFLAAAIGAILFRVNLPVAAFTTLYTNPFTIVPLYYCAYKLGQVALLRAGESVPALAVHTEGMRLRDWLPAMLDWAVSVGKPLLIGLPLLAALLAITGFVAVNCAWRLYVGRAWHRRRQLRINRSPSAS